MYRKGPETKNTEKTIKFSHLIERSWEPFHMYETMDPWTSLYYGLQTKKTYPNKISHPMLRNRKSSFGMNRSLIVLFDLLGRQDSQFKPFAREAAPEMVCWVVALTTRTPNCQICFSSCGWGGGGCGSSCCCGCCCCGCCCCCCSWVRAVDGAGEMENRGKICRSPLSSLSGSISLRKPRGLWPRQTLWNTCAITCFEWRW